MNYIFPLKPVGRVYCCWSSSVQSILVPWRYFCSSGLFRVLKWGLIFEKGGIWLLLVTHSPYTGEWVLVLTHSATLYTPDRSGGFASTVIPGFSLLEIHDREFCSVLDTYMFRNGASSSAKGGRAIFLCRRYVCCWVRLTLRLAV
jgi:hypothetical protein